MRKTTALGILALLAIVAGCGGGGGGTNPPNTTPAELTAQGWTLFEGDDFSGALAKFNAAITADAGYAAAYVGKGWAQLDLATSTSTMQAAATTFSTAISLGANGADARGGRAAANLGAGGSALAQAISDAQAARAVSPQFVFSHRTSFTVVDLRLIEAFAQAAMGDFQSALDAADTITSSGILDGDPATWVVNTHTYPTFTAAVLAFLAHLSSIHAG